MSHEGMLEKPDYFAGYHDGKSALYKKIIHWLENNKKKIIDDDLIKKAKKEL